MPKHSLRQAQGRALTGLIAGLSAASIWGGMYVVSKVVLEVIPPFALVTLRLVLGIATLWLIISLRGGLKVTAHQFWQVFGVGLIGYGISLGFQFIGTKLSTAANGSLVTSATPAFVLLFAFLLLKEPVTPAGLSPCWSRPWACWPSLTRAAHNSSRIYSWATFHWSPQPSPGRFTLCLYAV